MILLLLTGTFLKKRKGKKKSATIAVSALFHCHSNTQTHSKLLLVTVPYLKKALSETEAIRTLDTHS